MNVVPELSLPESWARTKVGDLRRDHTTTLNPATYPNEIFELYSIPAHETGKPELVRGRDIGSAKKSLSPDTVLLSKINPRINRVWVVGSSSGFRQIGSSEWIAFGPIEGLVPRYLAYYLRQDRFRTYLASNVSGVGGSLMRAPAAVVDQFPFALPSSREQLCIVDALDSYLTRLDDAVANLERVQAKLRAYRASVLKAAVEGRLVPTEAPLARAEKRDYDRAEVLLARILNERRQGWEEAELARLRARGRAPTDEGWKSKYEEPLAPDMKALPEVPEGWCWATLGALSTIIRGVTYQQSDARSEPGPGVVPLLRATNIGEGLTFSDLVYVPERVVAAEQRLCAGDIVVASSSGSRNVVGKAATLGSAWNGTFGAFCMVVRPVTTAIAPYLSLFLMTPWYRERVSRLAAGVNINNLKRSHLEGMPIPLPPAAEVGQIVDQVERQLSVAGGLISVTGHVGKRCARLRQAILKSAFEGKLVDQDPTDEPPEKLLARIRAERAGVSPAKKSPSGGQEEQRD